MEHTIFIAPDADLLNHKPSVQACISAPCKECNPEPFPHHLPSELDGNGVSELNGNGAFDVN
eukprot:scaffold51756_cov15-Tisochrysis_lutea.AAC.1